MKLRSYDDYLSAKLKDTDEAANYLTACYQDSEAVFLLALRQVVDAYGGVGALADETKLNRESLYRTLSENGNPQLSSLAKILETLGLKIQFAPVDDEKEAA